MNFKIFTAIFFLLLPNLALSSVYQLDPGHSTIEFRVKHLLISSVVGNFKKFSGSGEYDEKTGKVSNAKVTILVGSINTNNEKRDAHLLSDEFFEEKKFPEITFSIEKITFKGAASKKIPKTIEGKISLHGVTKNLVLEVTEWGGTAIDPWGNERMGFKAQGSLDRRDFGLTWNKTTANPLTKVLIPLIGNEIKLDLEIQAIKQPPKKDKA